MPFLLVLRPSAAPLRYYKATGREGSTTILPITKVGRYVGRRSQFNVDWA